MSLKFWKPEIHVCQIKLALNMFGGHVGLTLTRFSCFAKFRFTRSVFEDPLLLVLCDTLPLGHCFVMWYFATGVLFCYVTLCHWGTVLLCDTLPLGYCFVMWHFASGVLFCYVTLCHWGTVFPIFYFNWMFSLHCQGSMILTLQPLKMKAVCSFRALVHTSLPIHRHIPADLNSHMFWYCLARLIWLWFGYIKLCVSVANCYVD
jgi:hypothetical protein